ncbi:hypothetical protein BB560_003318 [Smittium megazygosporum]|uniref:LSM2-LSM8 complex subunit LSM8 n=1 Tax=Smittium megazygosporum TaxID=133381 RepID=A0A2T9ZCF9_9FUNG|nr:hypothetical protein BB560_003318 [Smittium megazygosporum]
MTERVAVLTNDGRILIGILEGLDIKTNLLLKDTIEKVFSIDSEVENIELGLYIIRGDSITLLGPVDKELEDSIKWDEIRCQPIKPIVH